MSEEEIIYNIEDLKGPIGPYQTEGFIELNFTIKEIYRISKKAIAINFLNGREVILHLDEDSDSLLLPRDGGIHLFLEQRDYQDGDTEETLLSQDRVIYYLTKIGSL